jgi:hypothetical protein
MVAADETLLSSRKLPMVVRPRRVLFDLQGSLLRPARGLPQTLCHISVSWLTPLFVSVRLSCG